jgi:hypothetical protein
MHINHTRRAALLPVAVDELVSTLTADSDGITPALSTLKILLIPLGAGAAHRDQLPSDLYFWRGHHLMRD